MYPIAASDTVTLAMERTRRMLFRPFRFSLWWRMAVLAFFTGEISGGGLPNLNFRSGIEHPSVPDVLKRHLTLVVSIAVVIAILYFVFLYIASVLHFLLFEAVLTGTTRLREGWRRWRDRAGSYYLFNILMLFLSLAVAAAIGIPAFIAYRAGVFSSSHLGLAVLVGALLACAALVLFFALTLIAVMTKDLVIPIMMFEGLSVFDGWRRAWPLIKTEASRYAGFYGLKIVLRIAASVLFTIVLVVIVVILLIPVVIVAVIVGIGMKGGGMHGIAAIAALVIAAAVVFALFVMLMAALLGTPIAVFFTSYTLQFFGARYEPLRVLVYPEPPPLPPSVVPVMPPIIPVPPPAGA